MSYMSKRTVVKGALFLTITGFATRLLGFYNKIFLTRLIGVSQLGIYQLIFPIYILAYALSSQGISLSLIKNTSYYAGKEDSASCRELFKSAFVISCVTSTICAALVNLFAMPISANFLHNTDCANLLKIISIAIPFVAIKSCFNSFFVGLERPYVQGTSHFYEQIIRISATYFLFLLAGITMKGAQLAVIAVLIGEICAAVYSGSYYLLKKKKYMCSDKGISLTRAEKHKIWRRLIKDTIPLSINNITITLFSTVESILLPAMLLKYYGNADTSIAMYGILSGIVMPFLMFPSTITNSISTMLMPSVSNAVAANDTRKIKSTRNNTIVFCSALGLAAWLFFALFGKTACKLTFGNTLAGELLSMIGFLCPLIYLSQTQSAILNGMGKTYKNLLTNLLSIVMRIIIIQTMVPLHGVAAYIFALVASYTTQNILLIMFTAKA